MYCTNRQKPSGSTRAKRKEKEEKAKKYEMRVSEATRGENDYGG